MKRISIYFLIPIIFVITCKNAPKVPFKSNNVFYDKAIDYRDAKIIDSSFAYFNKAKDLFLNQKDSLGVGKCLVNMAIISTDKSDYNSGQEISLEATTFLKQNDKNHHVYLSSNYNNLGIASYNIGDYKDALKFYKLAIRYSVKAIDTRMYLNNMAKVYADRMEYQEALKIYEQAMLVPAETNIDEAKILTNYNFTKWLNNPQFNAAPKLLSALNMRLQANDLEGLNSSYGNLSDFYANSKPDSAFTYAQLMLDVAKKLQSPDDELRAARKLVNLSKPKATKSYFDNYQHLIDSVYLLRNASANKFAVIRYDAEKLKNDKLLLLEENNKKKYQLILLVVTAALIFIGGIFWHRKRKQNLELQAQNTIRENQLKTSKKVHDVVANGLYRVMAEVENKENLDREYILDKIEDLYEKSRDISYDEVQFAAENFHEKIADLITSFATANTKVILVGNKPELWNNLNTTVKYEVEHVLQELLVNMKKHSQASNVAIRFEQNANLVNIYYTDNGIGMPIDTKFKNGLTNTGNRINTINGTITFDKTVDKGLKILISFPSS